MQKNNNETQNYRDKNGAKSIWKRKKSYALMLAISSAMYGNAYAEETPDTDVLTTQEKALEESTEVIEIRGMRGAIMKASDIKRSSGTIIDSIAPGIPIVDRDANLGLRGNDIGLESRSSLTKNKTEDYSLNVKWKISDTIRSNFDLQKVDASVEAWDLTAGFGIFADTMSDDQLRLLLTNVRTGVVKRSESMHNHEEYLKLAKLMDLNS